MMLDDMPDRARVAVLRSRLQAAHDRACRQVGETVDSPRVQALIDKFPDLDDSDLLTVAWEYQQVFRDALRACEP